jgi:hypothetical protein
MSDTAVVNPASQVSDVNEVDTGKSYSGSGNKKILNPFTGKEETREGSFSLPLYESKEELESALSPEDIVFWTNAGRKYQARLQMYAALDATLDNEALNEDYQAFMGAYGNMVNDQTPEERKEVIRQFILSEPKFDALKGALAELKQRGGFPPVNIDFGQVELKKPSGVRGKRAK